VLSPIWRRWWFLTLAALAIAVIVQRLYRYRVGRALQLANLRTRIATDLHDDIGANLTRIAILSDATADGATGERDAAIGRIARESVGAMSDIVWAIKPEREGQADLARRMRRQADEMFVQRDVALRFTAPPADVDIRLDVDVRHDVLLFFKEAVTNVARHSQCTNVAIDLAVDRSRLTLTVADNGVGFDTTIDFDGQGLRGLRRRAARLGADLAIASSPGRGTVVSLTVPL
jgi:signal transduction histidine kinase